MTDTRWKRQERAVAAAVGGQRLPNNGRGQPDIRLPGWALQVKTTKALPAWLTAAVSQAERDATAGERPAVVLCEATQGIATKRYAVMDLEMFKLLIADVARKERRA